MIDGRIIKGVGGLYTIDTNEGTFFCRPRGIFRKKEAKVTPVIGDYVQITILDNNDMEGVIDSFYDRKNELSRPKVSNLDMAIVVASAVYPTINLELLDRFIVLSEEQNLEILICITKIDLVTSEELERIKDIYTKIGYNIIFIDTFIEKYRNEILKYIMNKECVLAGPSGVGKSSIINLLIPEVSAEVGEVGKKTGRGKHTTRHSELLKIEENTFVVDSPGFSSIDINHIKLEDLQYYFKEFEPYIGTCKFSDCLHLNEPGCSIIKNVSSNIFEERYSRYLSFFKEIEENEKRKR